MTVNEILMKMITQANGNTRDVAHFLKVYSYARLIGEQEHLDERTQKTLEITAVIHDIACPLCREKYGNVNGKHQEEESAPLVEAFLKDTGVDKEMGQRINYLVCHHHTYTDVDGMDYRILLEADYLVNADESKMSKAAIQHAKETFFVTETGKKLLDDIFLS